MQKIHWLPISVFSFGLLLSVFSCTHSPLLPDDDFTPVDTTGNPIDTTGGDTTSSGTPCDPNIVYFNIQVLPILRSNCAKSGCHDEITHEDGVVLTSYENVMNTADVRPFNLNGSDLYEHITETDPDKRMPPPPNSALSSDQINLIAKWILEGAQNLECDPDAGQCNTSNVTYSGTIRPLIINTCQGCHSGSAPSAGINLTTYQGIATVANNGRLYGAISHTTGFVAMPYGGNKLSQCAIDKVKAWIDSGAPNN